jgi:hypothetical protein
MLIPIIATITSIIICMTRIISYYTNIPAPCYLVLIPYFINNISNISIYYKLIRITTIDKILILLIILPAIWAPISLLLNSDNIILSQFWKCLFIDTLAYSAYFSTRYVRNIKFSKFTFYLLLPILVSSIMVYLQQYHIIGYFYPNENINDLMAFFEDKENNIVYRNPSFYGNWHDAGIALSFLVCALYVTYENYERNHKRYLILILLGMVFGSLLLTSARAEIILTIVTLFIYKVIFNKSKYIKSNNSNGIINISILLIISIFSYYVFTQTIFLNNVNVLSLSNDEGRIDTVIASLNYLLLQDPLKGLLGWGLGTGGIAVVEGMQILPINTVDNTFIIYITNYGIIGLLLRFFLISKLTYILFNFDIKNFKFDSYGPLNTKILLELCKIGFLYTSFTFIIGEAVMNRIWLIFLTMVTGLLINSRK